MARQFMALRVVGTIFKVLAWLVLILGLLGAAAGPGFAVAGRGDVNIRYISGQINDGKAAKTIGYVGVTTGYPNISGTVEGRIIGNSHRDGGIAHIVNIETDAIIRGIHIGPPGIEIKNRTAVKPQGQRV